MVHAWLMAIVDVSVSDTLLQLLIFVVLHRYVIFPNVNILNSVLL